MCKRNIDQLPLTHPQMGTWPATQACALTGNGTSDLSIHRPALNPLSHTSQPKLQILQISFLSGLFFTTPFSQLAQNSQLSLALCLCSFPHAIDSLRPSSNATFSLISPAFFRNLLLKFYNFLMFVILLIFILAIWGGVFSCFLICKLLEGRFVLDSCLCSPVVPAHCLEQS